MTRSDAIGAPRPRRIAHSFASTRRLQHAGKGESGAILLLALVFITVIMTLTLAVLSLAQTGATSLRSFRLERTRRYAVDAALEAAVQMVKLDPTLGVTTSPPACNMNYAMGEDTASGNAFSVIAAGGSTLKVVCTATTGTTSGGLDTDGGQAARDVTFEVQCNTTAAFVADKLSCTPGGSTVTVLARARVRYDIDYSLTPAGATCNQPAPNCTASNARAVVPKVVYWSIKG